MSQKQTKLFELSFSGSVVLTEDEIWPDGDAPETPTYRDVLRRIGEWRSRGELIRDWSLDDVIDVEVNDVTNIASKNY